MKKLVLLFAALLVAGEAKSEDDPFLGKLLSELQDRGINGYFEKNKTVGYTGKVHDYYRRKAFAPDLMLQGHLTKGRKDGRWVWFHENGQKMREATYKDGKPDGPDTTWYSDGQKERYGTYEDGKIDGLYTEWHENGNKRLEGTFKDSKKDGRWTGWHANGQKNAEGIYKDGKMDGLQTVWHENGQKKAEGIYKDGEEVSVKYWDRSGKEVETREEAEE